MKAAARWAALILVLLVGMPAESQAPARQAPQVALSSPVLGKSSLRYGVEWKMVRAGLAQLDWTPREAGRAHWQADLKVESLGMVSKLYRVDDTYTAQVRDQLCADSVFIRANEGRRRRETKVTFDRARGKANYLETDLVANKVALTKEIETPSCVHEWVGGLTRLRALGLEPGQSATVPVSDGKKFSEVKVEAQEKEKITTPAGQFQTTRYEVHMMNGVLIQRSGRVFVWVSNDAQRLPVQLQVRLPILIGNITFQLEKDEKL